MTLTAYKEFWTVFIDIYRSLPCLWDTKDENYNNRESRTLARNKLVEKLQEVEPDANQDSVKRKINTFRSNFNREVRKVRRSQRQPSAEVYKPTLWYFDQLSFLMNQEKCNNGNGASIDSHYDEDITLMDETTANDETMVEYERKHAETIDHENTMDDDANSYEKAIKKKSKLALRARSNSRDKLAEPLIEYSPVFEVLKTEKTSCRTSSTEPHNFSPPENHVKRLENTNNRSVESERIGARMLRLNPKRSKLRLKAQNPYIKNQFKSNAQTSLSTDEADIYGQAWACGFRKLSPQQKLFAKKAIDEILILGQLKALKLNTVHIKGNLLEETSDQG